MLLSTIILCVSGHAQADLNWVARYSGPSNVIDQAKAIVADASGNTYVTGSGDRNGPMLGGDIVTLKFDADGNQVWAARYVNPGSLGDAGNAIAVDAAGNVYVTGYSHGHPSFITAQDYVTIKYSPEGAELWAARYSAPTNTLSGAASVDYPKAIAVDAAGYVYVTGISSDSGGNARDYVTVKYTPNGNLVWNRIYDSPGHGNDSATSLALGSAGEVYVGGFSGVVKYSSSGDQLWSQPSAIADLALDPAGNVVAVGPSFLETTDEGEQPDFQIKKYSPGGECLWTAGYDGAIHESDSAGFVRIDAAGNIYITGNSASHCEWVKDDGHLEKSCETAIVTLKLDSSGRQLWAARYGGTGQRTHFPIGLDLDAHGNAYVVGSEGPWSGTVTVKYTPDGTRLWAAVYSATNHGWDSPAGIAVSAIGDVHVAGSSHWWDGHGSDYFVLKYVSATVPGIPIIQVPPQGQAAPLGTDVSLQVSATGAAPLLYQWHLNNEPIAGATNATLLVPGIGSAHEGDYSVKVRNSIGSVVSPLARVTTTPALPRLHSAWKSGQTFGFRVECSPALSFVIETSTNLQHWTALSTNIGQAGGLSLSFPGSDHESPRFFRMRPLGQ